MQQKIAPGGDGNADHCSLSRVAENLVRAL